MTTHLLTNKPESGNTLDIAELTHLAGDFFRQLPGRSNAIDSTGVTSLAASFQPSPTLVPQSPQAFGAPLPGLPSTSTFATGSLPYAGTDSLDSLAEQALHDRVQPQSFGFPGQGELESLVRTLFTPKVVSQQDAINANHSYWDHTPSYSDQINHQSAPFDLNAVRRDFPILSERVNGKPLAWLDNAATTQKPQAVIDRLSYFYAYENSNIHRAAHELAARATDAYEAARNKVAKFLGAASSDEVIFVRGATEAINLLAQTYGKENIKEGDEIIVSLLEHHANIVPWQQLAQEKGAHIRVIPVDDSGQILIEEFRKLLNSRTKLVSITQVSNALGTVVPVKQVIDIAHQAGVKVIIDGAQAVSHMRVNVQALDADFYVFSGHKVFGPTGIGVVYGKKALLEQLPPWQGGGNMIADVTFERTIYQGVPARFEAGTGNIADAVGLGAAIDYLDKLGMENIAQYEHALLEYGTRKLLSIPGVRLIGTAKDKASVLSFILNGYETEEVGKALNEEGIAVRSGHHCAQPILRRFGLEATVRPSLAFYNTCEEIDRLVDVVRSLSGKKK